MLALLVVESSRASSLLSASLASGKLFVGSSLHPSSLVEGVFNFFARLLEVPGDPVAFALSF